MEILDEAFYELNRFELASNHCHFSTEWLNKSPRYYSMIRSSGREPSVDALVRLAANLKARHEMYRTSRLGMLRERAEWIYPLTKKVWTKMYERALPESVSMSF